MQKKEVLFLIFVIVFALSFVNFAGSSQFSSSNYGTDIIVSDIVGNSSSSSYETTLSSTPVAENLTSSSYKTSVGFASLAIPPPTPTTPVTPTPAGGGGVSPESFSISKDLIRVLIKQGESSRELIKITNNLNSPINFQIDSSLKEFMVISEESFSLAPKESKTIFIDFFSKENEIPDAYTGKIIVAGNNISKVINLIIEVKERKPLFDVLVQVLSKEVLAGKDVKAKLKVFNLGDLRNIDIKIYYSVQDFDGKILSFKEESIAINEELKVTRSLRVPKATPVGDYVFYLKASYMNITASSTETFEVIEQEAPSLFLVLLIFCIVLIILILIIILILLTRFYPGLKRKKQEKIIKEVKEKGRSQIINLFTKLIELRRRRETEKRKLKQHEEKLKYQRRMETLSLIEKRRASIRQRKARQRHIREERKKLERKKRRLGAKKMIRDVLKSFAKFREQKEKEKPGKEVERVIKKSVKEQKKILRMEKKVKRKLVKEIQKRIKKKKRKQKIQNLKKIIKRKKKELEYKKRIKKEIRKSKKNKKKKITPQPKRKNPKGDV